MALWWIDEEPGGTFESIRKTWHVFSIFEQWACVPFDSLSPINLLPLSTLHSQYCMLSLLRCKFAFFSVGVMTKQYDNQEQHQHRSRLSAIKELYKTNKQTNKQYQHRSPISCHHSTVLTSRSPLWKADDTVPARHREEGTASQGRQAFVGLPRFPANVFVSKLCHKLGTSWKMIRGWKGHDKYLCV